MKYIKAKKFALSFSLAAATFFSGTAFAASHKPAMRVLGATSAPIGFIRFCSSYPRDCSMHSRQGKSVRLSNKRWREVVAINDFVNRSVEPITDADLYGVAEHWTYPQGAGDCEDYVILKRRMLLERGWPASALLMTVVRDTKGDGHAVLTVRTDRGDFILDNQEDRVLRWDQTPYQYVKRQSEFDAYMWADIADDRAMIVGSLR